MKFSFLGKRNSRPPKPAQLESDLQIDNAKLKAEIETLRRQLRLLQDDPDRRFEAEEQAHLDLEKSVEWILTDVHHESYKVTDPQLAGIARLVCRFAGLLAILNQEEERRSILREKQGSDMITRMDQIGNHERMLIKITWVLAALTLGLFIVELAKAFGKGH